MKREIISIDEELCNGCGLCVPGCHEGALQIIDGKARLISDLMCDGLGACIGHCPEGAITIIEREAEAYDEVKVMEQMVAKGESTILAHLRHLKDHQEMEYLAQGIRYMLENRDELGFNPDQILQILNEMNSKNAAGSTESPGCGCPGSETKTFGQPAAGHQHAHGHMPSALTHWPVQMHLINPGAGHFKGSHLLLAADCTAFTLGSFHRGYLNGKTLGIACPKLDSNRESYVEKLRVMVDESQIDMMTVMIMEVPCCSSLVQIADLALSQATRQIPVKLVVVSVDGEIKIERWHKVA